MFGIRRRVFLAALGGVATWPLAARAQRPAMPVVGFVHVGSADGSAGDTTAFRKGLGEAGYVEGQNVRIEHRFADGRYDTMRTHVLDLIALRVAAIAVRTTAAALAAKSATGTIPIVFDIGADPVKAGLVERLNRPGGNLTGTTILTHALDAKRLQMIHEMVPTASTIGALFNPKNADAERQLPDLEAAARTLGQNIRVLDASTKSEINAAFKKLTELRADALIVSSDAFLNGQNEQIAALASAFSIPAIAARREFAASGMLLSYGPSNAEGLRQMGIYIGRILKGEKPADLPVIQPTRFEFVINLQTARTLGITVPSTLLAIADEVIE
jgi:putative ABC transport system substrate-binding protein